MFNALSFSNTLSRGNWDSSGVKTPTRMWVLSRSDLDRLHSPEYHSACAGSQDEMLRCNSMTRWFLFIPLALSVGLASAQRPQQDTRAQLEYTRSHYTKFDYRIPMRDGVKLFTT